MLNLACFKWRAAGRFAESIPLLAAMVETWPDVLQYRTHLMRAWHRTGNSLKLQETLQAAEEHFRGKQLWNEPVIAGLGAMAEMTGLFEKAVVLYQEAIPLHRKAPRHQGNQGNQGVGDGTLSAYYGNLARAFAGLGRTKEAVDAAAGAIVSWGRRQDQRAAALGSLLEILRGAKDLDAYAEALEKECRELKVENPTVRKALGQVYVERKEWAKARRQLEAAVEGGPTDPETSRALIGAYEGSGDRVGAAARLLALARGKGHDLALFRELGDRLKALERPEEAERAWTNLVELSANESEGRALLAEVREKDGRFLEAAAQWREVARIRSREPVGWLGLARDLIAGGRGAEAREPLEHLLKQAWPGRFGDVHGEARKLLERLGN